MKRSLLLAIVIASVGFAFGTAPARADTFGSISLTNCGATGTLCPAANYAFNIGTTSATLTITINSTPISGANYITSVDLGFTPANNILTLSPVVFTDTNPSVNPAGLYNNTYVNSINSAGNCTAAGSAAFVCASSSAGGAFIAQGDVLTWTWNYTLANPSNIDAQGNVHIGANYGPNQGVIVSTTVPEPSTIALLVVGLFGLGVLARRRLVYS